MKAKPSPTFPLAARAAHRRAGDQRQLDKALRLGTGFSQGVERFKALAADPQLQEISDTFAGKNPDKKLLASTSGAINALKSVRETAASWYVVFYGEDKEKRVSKTDPRRCVFSTMAEAEQWANGEHPGIAQIPKVGHPV